MTPLDYARRGWRVFPALRKDKALVKWKAAATTDEAQIREWWSRWPHALIGLPTGEHFLVLDVDVRASPTGFDTLERLGEPFWFVTPTVDTPSGGSHRYFRTPNPPIRNINGQRGRGIGPQLDWRGLGGYVIAPSPGSGCSWDPHLGIDTPLAEVPAALQERTLNGEVFAIGTLAGAGGIPENIALPAHYDPRRPRLAGESRQRRALAKRRALLWPLALARVQGAQRDHPR